MSEGKIDKLARMANQIGDFFAAMPEDAAAKGVATHLRRFWTPKMIRELLEAADRGLPMLNATTARALALLRQQLTT